MAKRFCDQNGPKLTQVGFFISLFRRKRYLEFRQSLIHFDALISHGHSGQVSLKSDKPTYPINLFEQRLIAQKQTSSFRHSKEIHSFRTSIGRVSMRWCRQPIKLQNIHRLTDEKASREVEGKMKILLRTMLELIPNMRYLMFSWQLTRILYAQFF